MSHHRGLAEEPQPFDSEANELRSVPPTRLKIDNAGRVVIPAAMREAMMVKPGDTVTCEVVDGEFRIVSPGVALKRVQTFAREWRKKNPGVSVVDELIAERRQEARQELDDANAWRKEHGLPPFE